MSRINTLCLPLLLGFTIPSLLVNWYGAGEWPCCGQDADEKSADESKKALDAYFLEVVTEDVDDMCTTLAAIHGVEFSQPQPMLGNARTAPMANGGLFSVRAPMHEQEGSVVRPYLLVDDIDAAVKKAEAGGAMIAMMPTESPGRGTFAIYFQGGIQYGLWQK